MPPLHGSLVHDIRQRLSLPSPRGLHFYPGNVTNATSELHQDIARADKGGVVTSDAVYYHPASNEPWAGSRFYITAD